MRFQHTVNEFYRKYGADGLLALIVNPLENRSSKDLEEFERQLTTKGLITHDGFTGHGLSWFNSQAGKSYILQRLEEINGLRRRKGLPAD